MKLNFTLGLILGAMTAAIVVKATSPIDQVAERFSPRLVAAVACTTLDQLNVIMMHDGMSTITTQQMMTAVFAKYNSLPPCYFETNSL